GVVSWPFDGLESFTPQPETAASVFAKHRFGSRRGAGGREVALGLLLLLLLLLLLSESALGEGHQGLRVGRVQPQSALRCRGGEVGNEAPRRNLPYQDQGHCRQNDGPQPR